MAGYGECGVMKGVRLDEGAVEVNAEHRQRGDVECGGRERQKCPFLRLTFYRHKKQMIAVVTTTVGLHRRPKSLSFILEYPTQ
jgi:hypothetical protein